MSGVQFQPTKVQILIIFAMFSIFTPKMQILTIFSHKSAILDNIPLLKVKNVGKFFHNFFTGPGKNRFF